MDQAKRQHLILSHYGLVAVIAARFARQLPASVDKDDLISAGTVGLIEAVDRFDNALGELKAFAEVRIKGAMVDFVRSMGWAPRSVRRKAKHIDEASRSLRVIHGREPENREVAAHMGMTGEDFAALRGQVNGTLVSVDAPVGDDGSVTLGDTLPATSPTPEEAYAEAQSQAHVVQSLDRLSQTERQVVSLCFNHGLTLREVGDKLGVTESRICQIRTQALRRLKALSWMTAQSARPTSRRAA